MALQFKTASKAASKLRLALAGPAGSGKTYTALAVASALAAGKPLAVVDTERGSASKYADLFAFDVLELQSFNPERYVEAIRAAEAAGFAVLVIDSLSHAWMGKDGALEQVDKAAKRSQSGNNFAAWRDVTPMHNAMVDAILAANMHIIVTMRSKTEYVIETNDRGKQAPRKIGLAPVQRDGLEYEFDVYADMTQDNDLIVGKTRCSALAGQVMRKPGADLAKILVDWLGGVTPAPKLDTPATVTTATAAAPAIASTTAEPIRSTVSPASASRPTDTVTAAPATSSTTNAPYVPMRERDVEGRAPDLKDASPFCQDCGGAIEKVTLKSGRVLTVDEQLERGKAAFGVMVCLRCGEERKRNKAAAA